MIIRIGLGADADLPDIPYGRPDPHTAPKLHSYTTCDMIQYIMIGFIAACLAAILFFYWRKTK